VDLAVNEDRPKKIQFGFYDRAATSARDRQIALAQFLRGSGICWLVVWVLLMGRAAQAQTSCSAQHVATGAFICYPNPSENDKDSIVPSLFHLSAQGNAADGSEISGYRVLIDSRLVYENKLPAPIQKLSIETNLKSPFDSGLHRLQVVFLGGASTEVKGLQFYVPRDASFCEPFTRSDPRTCNPSTIRAPFQWSLLEGMVNQSIANIFDGYSAYLNLYSQNLKRVEADVADAMAVDAQGNLYVASHAFADVDLRKYAPNGSLIYASLVRSCGDGFLSVAGLAIDRTGRAWIAGNTSACLSTTPNAIQLSVSGPSRIRGFVMLVDTTKPSSSAPLYVTYLSDVDSQIAAIRVNSAGNAYVIGTTGSLEFPHESLLNLGEGSQLHSPKLGFVSVLNQSGTGLLWSTLLPNTQLAALALDGKGNLYLTGRVHSSHPVPKTCSAEGKLTMGCDDVLVAELTDRGRRLSYAASFGGQADQEGRAISVAANGGWIFVSGDTDSPDFPASSANNNSRGNLKTFAVALEPCNSGVQYFRFLAEPKGSTAPMIALTPALDAFAAAFSQAGTVAERLKAGQKPAASVHIAPACLSTKR
jgi:hypothetical protein